MMRKIQDELKRDRKRKAELNIRYKKEKEDIESLNQKLDVINKELDYLRSEKEELGLIASKIEFILERMEKNRIHEYLDLVNNKKKLIYINIIIGISRGFGSLIGLSLVTALLIYILQQIISLNIPLIGDFIADIVRIVQDNLN